MTNLMSKKSFVDSNISINPQSLTDLTEGQKACLRLVVQHHTSKEIARKLGISRYTVDQRLDAARHKLNAASRKDAAKIFAERDTYPISQPFVYGVASGLTKMIDARKGFVNAHRKIVVAQRDSDLQEINFGCVPGPLTRPRPSALRVVNG